MTAHFVREIEALKKRILGLSTVVEESVFKAVRAVSEFDAVTAEAIIRGDVQIDASEVEVEEECLKILALYQPVAADLRFIVAVLKINNDLERIGDLAVNIAQRVSKLSTLPRVKITFDLAKMADRVKGMLRKSLQALVNLDKVVAEEVCASDDAVDDMNREMHREIHELIRKDVEHVENYILYLSVSRNLERIADHATNIAEDVIYMTEGEIIRHGLGQSVRGG